MWDFLEEPIRFLLLVLAFYILVRLFFNAYFTERTAHFVKLAKVAQEMNRNGA